jgi:hypothetical protein
VASANPDGLHDDIGGKLVPLVQLEEFKKYIEIPRGTASFKMRKSLMHDTYLLDYHVSAKRLGSAELFCWKDDEKRMTYIVLFSVNISGDREPFEMLFKDIQGKMILNEIPFSALLDKAGMPKT